MDILKAKSATICLLKFDTRVLGYSSDRVLGNDNLILSYNVHCIMFGYKFRYLIIISDKSCANTNANIADYVITTLQCN